MAPTTSIEGPNGLVARFIGSSYGGCGSGYYYTNGGCYPRSSWYFWGRWLFAGIVIAFILVVLVFISCVNSRRRRKRGLAPRYGTGWMAPAHKYGNNGGGYVPPPPQYSATPMQNYPTNQQQPQYTGQTFNSNEGYYGGHNEGIAPPQNTYYPQRGVGGENVYEPPAGPPPGKH